MSDLVYKLSQCCVPSLRNVGIPACCMSGQRKLNQGFRNATHAQYRAQLSHTPSTRRNSANKRAFGVSCCLPFPAEGGCCEDLCSAVFAEPAASFFPLDARPRRTPNGALDVRRRGWFPPPGPPRGKSGIATITKTLLVRYPPGGCILYM